MEIKFDSDSERTVPEMKVQSPYVSVETENIEITEYPEERSEWDENSSPKYVGGLLWSIVGGAIVSGLMALISYNTLWYSMWLFLSGGFILGTISYNTFKNKGIIVKLLTAGIGALSAILYLWLLDRLGFIWDNGKSLLDDMTHTIIMFAIGSFIGCNAASKLKDQEGNW